MTDDTENGPIATRWIGETGLVPATWAKFAEDPFDRIGGAHLRPMRFGTLLPLTNSVLGFEGPWSTAKEGNYNV
jgi:hypothetical protein